MGRDRGRQIGYMGSPMPMGYMGSSMPMGYMGSASTPQPVQQSFVQGSLGSSKGDINYDAFSDFDNDGIVSTADFAAYKQSNPSNASMIETPEAQYSRMMGQGIMGLQQRQPMYNPNPMPFSSRQQFGFGGNSGGKANTGRSVFGMANGGLIKGYQDGGPMLDPMMGMETMDNQPVSDMDMMAMGSGELTGPAAGADNEMLQIVLEAKAALEGNHPDPVSAIERFVEVFGEEELMSLKDYVVRYIQTGEDQFTSDGMSDSIPGNIDGMEPVALSEGEYVVPADVVSSLGNGDTQSGASRMREMIERVRMAKNGSPEQPPAIDPSMFMNM